jgi:hypothetical protein
MSNPNLGFELANAVQYMSQVDLGECHVDSAADTRHLPSAQCYNRDSSVILSVLA